MQPQKSLNLLREQGRMAWIAQEHAWVAVPEDIMEALLNDGFLECKRELTTSRRDSRPAGGLWQGVNPRTGSVASAIWVHRPLWPHAMVFIGVDGEPLSGSGARRPDRDPHREDGG